MDDAMMPECERMSSPSCGWVTRRRRRPTTSVHLERSSSTGSAARMTPMALFSWRSTERASGYPGRPSSSGDSLRRRSPERRRDSYSLSNIRSRWRMRRVVAGAELRSQVTEEHGWLLGRVVDPFGHEWEIGRPLGAWPPPAWHGRRFRSGSGLP